MDRKSLARLLNPSFKELDPKARRVALLVCRAHTNAHDGNKEMRTDFDLQNRAAKRSVRALKRLAKELVNLEADINAILQHDAKLWCDILREAHIPDGSPALLPTYKKEPTLKDYLRTLKIPDPAEPLEQFLLLQADVRSLVKREVIFVAKWLQTRARPRQHPSAPFFVSGSLQYALHNLFKGRTRGKLLRENQIEIRVAKILNDLHGGGPSVDPDTRSCAAIRQAIKRLPDGHKRVCDRFLSDRLNSPRT